MSREPKSSPRSSPDWTPAHRGDGTFRLDHYETPSVVRAEALAQAELVGQRAAYETPYEVYDEVMLRMPDGKLTWLRSDDLCELILGVNGARVRVIYEQIWGQRMPLGFDGHIAPWEQVPPLPEPDPDGSPTNCSTDYARAKGRAEGYEVAVSPDDGSGLVDWDTIDTGDLDADDAEC